MKHLAYQLYSQNPNQFTLNVYQAKSGSRSRLMRLSRRQYETDIAPLPTSNPKVFFAHVRRNRQFSRQIISLETDLGVNVEEPEAQAEILNAFFHAVFRTDAVQPIPALSIPSVMTGIPAFTPCLVHKELSTLDTSKNAGPDQLHPKLLKWLATFLAEPLADLFNNSLATAVVAAVSCPMFKKGNPGGVANYRPVSLTLVLCKVFERILKRVISSLKKFLGAAYYQKNAT